MGVANRRDRALRASGRTSPATAARCYRYFVASRVCALQSWLSIEKSLGVQHARIPAAARREN